MINNKRAPLLEFRNINKSFSGVKVLDDVSLEVDKGEVMAILGENGAGKSTLMKILSGAYDRDSGKILIDGVELPDKYGPSEARKYGIAIIYQELSLMSELSVAENIYLAHEPLRIAVPPVINYNKMFEDAKNLLRVLHADHIDVKSKVSSLPLPERQMVEIAKALAVECKIIVMDEPTTSLTWEETKRLFDVIRSLKEHGVTVIYISHRIDEIFQICDSATIMRDGKVISHVRIKETTKEEIISMMTGKQLHHKLKATWVPVDYSNRNILLRVENLSDNKFIKDVSFSLYENEVLGFGGLIGSKRTEIARMIIGADKLKSGSIYLRGKKIKITSVSQAIKNGIGYLSENRKEEGLNLGLTIRENIILTDIKSVSMLSFVIESKVQAVYENYSKRLQIKGKAKSLVGNLSGGNQQKVAIAKWLHAGCNILIFDEPTKGIDVGTKAEIYEMIRNFAKDGKAAIVISSDANELVDVCDRVIIMSKGEITNELKGDEITQESILQSITMKGM